MKDFGPGCEAANSNAVGVHRDATHLGHGGNVDDRKSYRPISQSRIEIGPARKKLATVSRERIDSLV
jgi:hypothetical protein